MSDKVEPVRTKTSHCFSFRRKETNQTLVLLISPRTMDSDRQAPSYSRAMDHSIMPTDSSELTAAAALTSLVSGMGHNARSLPPPPNPNVNVHQHPCKLEGDFEFPTQFTKSGRKKAVPFPVRVSSQHVSARIEF